MYAYFVNSLITCIHQINGLTFDVVFNHPAPCFRTFFELFHQPGFLRCFPFSLLCYTLEPCFTNCIHVPPCGVLSFQLIPSFSQNRIPLRVDTWRVNVTGSCHRSTFPLLFIACNMRFASIADACALLQMLLFFVLTFCSVTVSSPLPMKACFFHFCFPLVQQFVFLFKCEFFQQNINPFLSRPVPS